MKAQWRIGLVLLAIVLGAVIRQSVTFKDAPDALYHLRRARFALERFPKTIIFDPTINFPDGGVCIWPPLFDVSLALPALIAKGPHAPVAFFERWALWMPVPYTVLAILGASLAGWAVRRRWGFSCGLFVALCPGHLQYSQLGHADQHVAESAWGFLAFAFLLWSCRKPSRWLEAGAGLFLALSVLTWQGAIFWAPIFAATLAARILLERDPPDLPTILLILGLPAILVSLATWYWLDGFQVPFTYVSFGWFQPVFLCLALAGVAAIALLASLRTPQVGGAVVPRVLLLLAAAAPVLWFGRPLAQGVLSGMRHLASVSEGSGVVSGGFLVYPKEWLRQIVEYRPLLADGWGWPFGHLSLAFFLAPLVIALWTARVWRRVRPGFHAALVAWALFTFLFTLSQRRNVYYASLVAAIAGMELAAVVSAHLRRRLGSFRPHRPGMRPPGGPINSFGPHRPGIRPPGGPIFAGCLLALMLPMLLRLPSAMAQDYEAGKDRMELLAELKRIAPRELDAYDPRFLDAGATIPELKSARSVLAFWSQGHLVTYYSELPVVADNFGYAFLDSIRFFFAESEADALAIARAHRVRFVVSLDIVRSMNQYGAAIGKGGYLVRSGQTTTPGESYFRTLQARLHDFDGLGAQLGGLKVEPLSHFRLRHASASGVSRFGRFISAYKIFEVLDEPVR